MAVALTTVKAVCPLDCPDTCGMLVGVDPSGTAVSLRGDPDHPFTRGFLCRKVSRYLERAYHPDRLMHPLRRVGPKGSGRWQRVGWDEAIAEVAANFRRVIADHGPEAILPYSYAGTMGKIQSESLDRRFFHRLGASLLERTICASAGTAGCDMTLGTRAAIDPEAAVHARLMIHWGSNTRVTNSHFWPLVLEAKKRGAKIVTIDPYRSDTAAHSDQWLAIRPGTDAALALGIMHVLFRDDLIDGDYVSRYTLGVGPLRERALSEFSPAVVSGITGLSVLEIEGLASDYGRCMAERGGPALIRLNYGLQRHGGGGMAVRTITCLPALTGDWRHPGGGALLSTSRLSAFNTHALERPDLIPPGTRTVNMVQLADALHGELPGPPVMALAVYNCNPASVAPDQTRVISGLKRPDLFTVVLEHFLTDTADYADVVLPATTQLEHFDLHSAYGHLMVQANLPAIAPLGECKPNSEIFRLLGRAMGLEEELFAASDVELAAEALTAPGRWPGKHFPPAGVMEGVTLERLLQGGAVRVNLPKDFAPFAEGKFDTPSGKCEFYSERMARMGLDPVPNYTPPHEDPFTRPELAALYPLQMVCPPEPAFLNSTFANVGTHRRAMGEPKAYLHPADAEPRGIVTGDVIEIFNGRGNFRVKAIVAEAVAKGTVATFGLWWSKTIGGNNCNAATSTKTTDLGGGATFFDALVEVRKAEPS
jgi:anaerobic selenocysteine-containing dehydrogenase